MTLKSHLLYAYGFVNKGATIKVGGQPVKIDGKTPEQKLASIRKIREKYDKENKQKELDEFDAQLENAAAHDTQELTKEQEMLVDYPAPITKYVMIHENPNINVEQQYFWLINCLREFGFPYIDKVTDVFTVSEMSSFYGASGQKLSLAQDKVSSYLATIGKLIKDLFALVRELRIIDERLLYYRDSMGIDLEKEDEKLTEEQKKQRMRSAEIALKGLWVDMVDGVAQGQKTGANILTMATQLQFTTLPDLFFSVHPKDRQEVDEVVEAQAGEFNKQVKNALKRKLYSYLTWKDSTYREMTNRREFNVKYLRQHYQTIRMYMNWVKPYLRHIERMQGKDPGTHPVLVSSFETTVLELEILGRFMAKGCHDLWTVVLISMEYRTKPQMQAGEPGSYHRGPVHVGEVTIHWRSYNWTTDKINNYIAMRNTEDFEMLGSIDQSLKDAMEALGDDLYKYLEEVQEGPPSPAEPKKPDIFEPFKETGKGAMELIQSLIPKMQKKDEKPKENAGAAKKMAKLWTWLHYKLFKKSHGMITW